MNGSRETVEPAGSPGPDACSEHAPVPADGPARPPGPREGREIPVLRHRTAQEAVAHQLRVEILTGELPPGTRLLQASVAERMETSTTPVREALRQLAAEGLLNLDPHRGVVVHEPTEAELEEIYEIRGVLEPLSIRKTVEHITAEELDAAERVHEQAQSTDDPGEWVLHNREFHAALAEASQAPLLAEMLAELRNRASLYVALSLRGFPDHIPESNDQHGELLAACRDRDEERAVDIICKHLGQTVELGHRRLEGQGAPGGDGSSDGRGADQ